ncbi:hypothetical protein CFK37_12205 [Virgibacillus phasianinus]|uniref:Type VII secretion protein EssB n=1 Tax=Virgibacillus phasianinus TaxID=2017483 RepID=A0A220U4L2_9BACI|nr:type VII secretion protein EssB/YukC [Virgibacillus phasianinus]ASK62856.1 hypothetical protein CFK37_12205 [Virgibacillus phasianinus]
MTDQFGNQQGSIKENDNFVIFEIPKVKTNLVADEQLEELKRETHLFLVCEEYTIEETMVRIYYKLEDGFQALNNYSNASREVKCKIARNILAVDDLFGTQYTTLLHPDNIYASAKGEVKFAHRGIRSVLPPEELSSVQLLQDLKKVFLFLFTRNNVTDISQINLNQKSENQDIIKHVLGATSIKEIEKALVSKPISIQKVEEKTQQTKDTNQSKLPKTNSKKPLIMGLLIGVIIGMLLLYVGKVLPMNAESTSAVAEYNEKQDQLESTNKKLKNEIANNKQVLKAYRLAVTGKVEESIASFEEVESLDKDAKNTLIEQYIALDTLESLTKASTMNENYHIQVVNSLVDLNSKEANDVILSIKSDKPEILIEQSWINNDYKKTIEIYKSISDNNRAKYIAAKSYIERKKPKESLKLARELKNKDLQLASLNSEKKLTKADDSLDEDKRKSIIDNINKAIDKLKK